jgi:hypothetical protein
MKKIFSLIFAYWYKKAPNIKKILIYLILSIPATLSGSAKKSSDTIFKIDITGNWQDDDGFKANIQTREPDLKDGELKNFSQSLKLPKGSYSILFEYEPEFDKSPGGAFENHFAGFKRFKINDVINPLMFSATSAKKNVYQAKCIFTVNDVSAITRLSLALHNTRVIRTWLESTNFTKKNKNYFAVDPGIGNEYLLIHNIPFLARKTDNLEYGIGFRIKSPLVDADRGSLKTWNNGMSFDLGGAKVGKLHFLGMIHKVDLGSGSWYAKKGDEGYSHFIGDKAGDIVITYQNDKQVMLPLIFGFNIWYGRPWDMLWFHYPGGGTDNSARLNFDKDLFSGDPAPRALIENALYLTDGTRLIGSRSSNTRFVFSLDMENMPIKSVTIKGVADMYGSPLVSAITVETSAPSSMLTTLPDISEVKAITKPVTVKYILDGAYEPNVEKLKRAIYTFKDDLPKLTEPEIPVGYFGPRYNFKGTQEAVYAATYLFRNGPECGAKIADNGTSCSSSLAQSQTVRYTLGTGIWRGYQPIFGNIQNWFHLYQTKSPGELPGAGEAWSRGIGELMREAMAFGYGKFINTYTHWLDSCLFVDHPAHWSRVPGFGETAAYKTRQVGDIVETGNRENDGHGICMMGRYMAYHWLGHPALWNEQHWVATKAAVDWIQWQLDTDTIFPGKRMDVLYTESECGNYEFYGSYNCLHGLKLSIIMAKELGKTAEVKKWTKLYNRLAKGIIDNEVIPSKFGPIWFTNSVDWMDEAQKMAHIQLAADGVTYTPLQDYAVGNSMEKKYLEIDRNTYRYLLKDKNYNCLRMYGYGQGMMTQSALLFDEMNDAENFINVMVDHCYLSHLDGWAAPEGIQLHKSGAYWMPVCGYLGQDSHLADSQKALRIMLGIDDNNPDSLRLVPRYPASWNQMSIRDFPVLADNKRQTITYSYVRDSKGQVFKYGFESPVKKISLRLGPIATRKEVLYVTLNGKKVAFEKLTSGDSRWIWINNFGGKQGKVKIQYQ